MVRSQRALTPQPPSQASSPSKTPDRSIYPRYPLTLATPPDMNFTSASRLGAQTALALSFAAILATPANAEKKKLDSVAVTVPDTTNPFFVQVVHGAQAKAKEINSKAKFTAESSGYDVKAQADQIDRFIASGTNLILLGAADSKGIAPAVQRAKQAGITVVAIDVGAEGGVDATVTSNNRQAGQEAGKYVADRLKGSGQVIIVNGEPVTAVTDRVAGFLEEINKHPDIKILSQDRNAEGTRAGGQRVMGELLKMFPKIDAVFAVNDPTAIGCDLAARQAQRKDFFIVGVDGAPEVVPALKDPQSLIAASAAQDPYLMAQEAVEIGNRILQGEKPKEAVTLIRVGLITRDNVARYTGWTK